MKNLDLNKSPSLPESDESRNSASGGALGGLSQADLVRGFDKHPCKSDGDEDSFLSPSGSGFLSRPQGHER